MLYIPSNDVIYRMVSIDPGTTTLGLSISEIHCINKTMHVTHSMTFEPLKLFKIYTQYQEDADKFGELFMRVQIFKDWFRNLLHTTPIHGVVCESAYGGERFTAFNALKECLCGIQDVIREFPTISLQFVTPNEAKKAIGVIGRKDLGKDPVRAALLEKLQDPFISRLRIAHDIQVNDLSEHAVDSIAIGYWNFISMFHQGDN